MSKKIFAASLFALFLIVGCGRGYQGLSGRCNQELIGDYNNIQLTYNAVDKVGMAQQFRDKYQGTVCTALFQANNSIYAVEQPIDVNAQMDAIIRLGQYNNNLGLARLEN